MPKVTKGKNAGGNKQQNKAVPKNNHKKVHPKVANNKQSPERKPKQEKPKNDEIKKTTTTKKDEIEKVLKDSKEKLDGPQEKCAKITKSGEAVSKEKKRKDPAQIEAENKMKLVAANFSRIASSFVVGDYFREQPYGAVFLPPCAPGTSDDDDQADTASTSGSEK
uniref:Uncharacterized protein n=1 Tax=Panagrolaimus sp. JU765 TaxID=591449 RepID=A0AC34QY94_9BILA